MSNTSQMSKIPGNIITFLKCNDYGISLFVNMIMNKIHIYYVYKWNNLYIYGSL